MTRSYEELFRTIFDMRNTRHKRTQARRELNRRICREHDPLMVERVPGFSERGWDITYFTREKAVYPE